MVPHPAGVLPSIDPEDATEFGCAEDACSCRDHDTVEPFDVGTHSPGAGVVVRADAWICKPGAWTSSTIGAEQVRGRLVASEYTDRWGRVREGHATVGIPTVGPSGVKYKDLQVEGTAAAWADLMRDKATSPQACQLYPQKRSIKAAAEPVMLAVENASTELLPLLLEQSERHADIFSTDIVCDLIDFKWNKYGRRLFFQETGLHLALVLTWQWVTVHDAQTRLIMFAEYSIVQGLAAVVLCAALGIGAPRLTCWMPDGCPTVLGVVAASACLLIGSHESSWSPFVLLAVLVALTARAVANEIRQLAHSVPSLADFDSDYPEANVDYQSTRSSQDIAESSPETDPSSETDSRCEQQSEQDGDSAVGDQRKVAKHVLGQEFERLLTATTKAEASTGQRPITHRRQLQRYLVGLLTYGRDPWNLLDVASLAVVMLSILRWVCHSNIETNSHFAAVGTFLLWIRVVEYLNGLEMTAAYVRMTMAVITDMMPFMLILALLIVGGLIAAAWRREGE